MTDTMALSLRRIMLKTKNKEELAEKREIQRLREERSRIRAELENSINNYNHVTDAGLMDFYIYQIRSQEALEQYLIHEIRKREK